MATTAYITHPSCLLHDMGADHPECPERLASINDHVIAFGLDGHVARYEAPAATREQLSRVHAPAYVEAIERAAPASGLRYLDPDTALNPHSVQAALHAAGAVVKGVDLVCSGEHQTAFCAVRPPGHHAERARAMGFCVFNNVAVGAAHALAVHDVSRVAIVDFDVHHGNGTEDMFSDDPRVLMVSTFQYPLYPYSGVDNPAPNMVNIPLSAGSGSAEFREAVESRWLPALDDFEPDLILVSAGFDAHREDPLAGLAFSENDYAWVTRQLLAVAARFAEGRIVSSLEGGYALSALGRSAAMHVRELMTA
ncbi:MAG TPA: histone deacetylase family protein [Casimicrobiaceae bacterium]|nr:histone deacetylase family protein [Casimicrobiaceae bacterium]